MKYYFFSALLFILANVGKAQTNDGNNGKLFIIGGGEKSKQLMKDLITVSNLRQGDFVAILPMSSIEPDSSYYYIREDFKTVTNVSVIDFNFEAGKVAGKSSLDSLKKARIIFITGGDQVRFMNIVLHTPIYDAIHFAFNNGSTIAGTSAGAAVMSRKMLTGNSLIGDTAYRETFTILQKGNLEIKEGLGLLDSAIIDQHFIVRSRYKRLLTAMAEFPNYVCIGIDEGTAIVVDSKKIRVTGRGQVIVMRQPQSISYVNGLIKFSDLKFSVYTAGDEFSLYKKKKPM